MKTWILNLLILFFVNTFAVGQTIVFTEDFESTPLSVTASSSSNGATWDLCNTLKKSGTYSDSAKVVLGDTLYLTTDTINTSAYNYVSLEFKHICKIDFFDQGIIQYSTDSGLTWSQTASTDYLGVGTLFQNSFSSISYSEWLVANSTAVPTQSWWKTEIFNLDVLAGYQNVIIRFVLIDADNNGAVSNYGWLIDDIKVSASSCELVPPYIQLTGNIYQGTVFNPGPFKIEANITDSSGISEAFIVYTKNNGSDDTVGMSLGVNGKYEGFIPKSVVGDTLCYMVYAIDSSTCANLGRIQISSCIEIIIKLNPAPTCVGTTIISFDYFENLSGFTAGNGFNQVGTLKSNWVNASGDDHDWYVYNQQTPSYRFGTGPQADHSPNDIKYLYIESDGHYQETANLITPCFDLTNLVTPQFSFWYHMNGTDMGELHLDVYFGGKWENDVMTKIDGSQGNSWKQQLIDLSLYAGNTIKLRFRGIIGNGFRSDIAIDDFELVDLPQHDVEILQVVSPSDITCNGTSAEPLIINIVNGGLFAEDSIPLSFQLDNGTIIHDTLFATIQSGDSLYFTFDSMVNMTVLRNYNFNIWSDLSNDEQRSNDSILNYSVAASNMVGTYPDTSDFDNFTTGTPGLLLDGWKNRSSNFQDWYVNSGTTPSSFTGPTGDHTGGFGNYVYMEATGVSQGETIVLESKCYDLSNLNAAELEFAYHMDGVDMGDLHLDVIINGITIEDIINPISGNQGSSWKTETVDLSAYSAGIRLNFRAICGSGYRSDIAIDDVIISDAQAVSVDELIVKSVELTVYPNPSRNVLFINSKGFAQKEVLIYDVYGKLILQQKLKGELNQLNVASISSGIYFVNVITDSGKQTIKIVKQ